MCNYKYLSKSSFNSIKQKGLAISLGKENLNILLKRIRGQKIQAGRCLKCKRALKHSDLSVGYYMHPLCYTNFVNKVTRKVSRCVWCSKPLPNELIQKRLHDTNPRENIHFSFHQECWKAHLLVVGIILKTIPLEAILRQITQQRQKSSSINHTQPWKKRTCDASVSYCYRNNQKR